MKPLPIKFPQNILLTMLLWGTLNGCSPKPEIRIGGSETMKEMVGLLADGFNKQQKHYRARVTGGGSKAGIEELTHGRLDIAMTSNDIGETHLAALADISKFEKVEIGYDGIAVVVNPANSVSRIDLLQYAQILSGKITNWKELGGADMAIIPVVRNRNSGTENFVREHILRRKDLGETVYAAFKDAEYAPGTVVKRNNREIFDFMETNPGAIAYMGVGVVKAEKQRKLKILDYALLKEGPFLQPSVENIQAGRYRLARPLAVVYVADGSMKDAFVAYALSEEGQKKVLEYEYLQAAPTTITVIEKRLPAK